jgi:hypothetical protein
MHTDRDVTASISCRFRAETAAAWLAAWPVAAWLACWRPLLCGLASAVQKMPVAQGEAHCLAATRPDAVATAARKNSLVKALATTGC